MNTYLVKDGTAYFYSRNEINPNIEGFTVKHYDKHPISLIGTEGIFKINLNPFKMNFPNIIL